MFFNPPPPIGDYDPYDTLKNLDQKVLELEQNLRHYIENQQSLDNQLSDIARALRLLPGEPVVPYVEYNAREKKNHSQYFDEDHQGGKFRQESSRIKELIKNLGKRPRPR